MNGQDAQHLKLLSIFHYVVGGLAFLCGSIFIIHIVIGIFALSGDGIFNGPRGSFPPFFGWIFVLMGSGTVLVNWVLGALLIAAGRCLTKRTHYKFCMVAAAIGCIFQPFGTVLGVFTIIVLCRESVKVAFGVAQPAAVPPAPPVGRAYT